MPSEQLLYWLAALFLPGVGPRKFLHWLNSFSSIDKLFKADKTKLHTAGLTEKNIKDLQAINWQLVEDELTWLNQPNHHIITQADEQYPALLKEISDPPLVLYLAGNSAVLNKTQLAMVGARNATPTGLQNAQQFAFALAETGLVITSGMAIGIDGASHRGALMAHGQTIAVAGTGLKHTYPPAHHSLAENIIHSGGAIISEFPLDTKPYKSNFPRRNRIISGLSLGVLVVEAALPSGSLITALQALEQGREVFAIPGSIHQPLSRGCHHLIRQGAKLVETAVDILEEMPGFKRKQAIKKSANFSNDDNISPELKHILAQIGYEITPMDVILLRSGLTTSEVSSMILTLELNGYIHSVSGGYIRSVIK